MHMHGKVSAFGARSCKHFGKAVRELDVSEEFLSSTEGDQLILPSAFCLRRALSEGMVTQQATREDPSMWVVQNDYTYY